MAWMDHLIKHKSIKTIYNEDGLINDDQRSFLKNNFDISILINQLYSENNILTLKSNLALQLFPIKNKLYNLKDDLIFNLCKQEPASLSIYNKKYNYIRLNLIVSFSDENKFIGYKYKDEFAKFSIAGGIICKNKFQMKRIYNNILKKEIVNYKLAKTIDYLGCRRVVGFVDLFYHVHFKNNIELIEDSKYKVIDNEEDLKKLLEKDIFETKIAADVINQKVDKQKKLKENLKNLKEIKE